MARTILYVGDLREWGTCFNRMKSLEELGYAVIPFGYESYVTSGWRILQSFAYRTAWGPRITRLNADLVRCAGQVKCDWVWIDKGLWIKYGTIEEIRRITGALCIHYTGDPLMTFHRTRHFVASVPHYDVILTTKQYEMDLYRKAGARLLLFSPKGYNPSIHRPVEVPDSERGKFQAEITFVGHPEPYYERMVLRAREASDNVAVWGSGWPKRCRKNPQLSSVVRGDAVHGDDYAKAICSAGIALGLLGKMVPETSTARSIEIPACGTFMLAERTDEHLGLFEEDKEAVFFASPEELVEKARFYLAHPEIRRKIAAAGRERCLKDGYSYRDRIARAIREIEAAGLARGRD
jgi:spore maturation protein CgeB